MTEKLQLLEKVFDKAEKQKKAVLLIGKFGIGKSSVVYQYAEKRAKELNRELKLWHELTEKEKKEIIENPEKYYVLVDIKGSMITPENLIMPKFVNGEIEWKVPLWAKVFEKEASAGILFIDEINMTPASLQAILFELILQRKIAETSLKSKNLLVIGAGNDLESNEYANEMPKPLLNRFIVIKFDEIVNLESFIKYAMSKKLDDRIINYVLFKNSLFTVTKEPLEQSTSPRSLEMLSDMIKDESDLEYIKFVAKTLLEEHDAIEFSAFVEHYETLKDVEKYIKKPELIRELDEEKRFIVIMKIVDYYLTDKIDIGTLIKVLEYVAKNITKEYVVSAITKIKYSDKEEKKNEFSINVVKNNTLMKIVLDILEFYENKTS